MGELVVGIDVGTTKICTLVGEVRADDIHVIGLGVEPSRGMKKGVVNDVNELTARISASIHKAERSSGYEIGRAFVSVAGAHIDSRNSRGVVGISGTRGVQIADLERAMEAARAIALPHNREVLHIIPRNYTLDGQDGIRSPLGMHGFRLEVEAHIVTAASSSLQNLQKCVEGAGVYVDRFILNPLASGEVVLSDAEREMGVLVIDIGGGTTDLAVFIEGTVWHTAVISVGGWHVTNDIAQGLHLPYEIAEAVKVEYGHADPSAVDPSDVFIVQPFGEEHMSRVLRADLAAIIQPRIEELFQLVLREIKYSAYDGLLSAGAVLTGGSAQLPGIKKIAADVLKMPVRIARPERVSGMADQLRNPSYSTSVGLLRLGLIMEREDEQRGRAARNSGFRVRGEGANGGTGKRRTSNLGKLLGGMMKRLLPEDEN
ncbi:MAG: cell division protein FtsA [Candidatus Thermofonsia Clade 1 bacterium]|uniref:Cell division protein FtsA n=1 Tax=Candidatus Thermofonsia Clade 1 bacterium TaxID=2364210 RepID=A0A2M8NY73_9CHLR|nr:MAG: cell division protein FtsA [Candidatus Thermofonsia Clade 1 bacterium]